MNIYDNAASIVVDNINDNNSDTKLVFIDPLTISVIAAILSALFQAIRLYCEIKKRNAENGKVAEQLIGHCKRKSVIGRMMVRRYTIQAMGGMDKFRKNGGPEIVNAILASGSRTSNDYMVQLLDG